MAEQEQTRPAQLPNAPSGFVASMYLAISAVSWLRPDLLTISTKVFEKARAFLLRGLFSRMAILLRMYMISVILISCGQRCCALIAGRASPDRGAVEDLVPHAGPNHRENLTRRLFHSPRDRTGTAAGSALDAVLYFRPTGYAIDFFEPLQIHGFFVNDGLLHGTHQRPPSSQPDMFGELSHRRSHPALMRQARLQLMTVSRQRLFLWFCGLLSPLP